MTDISIPAKWWGTLKPEESAKVFSTGVVEGEPLKRLWKMLKRKDKPPKSLAVFVDMGDLDRLFKDIGRKN